MVGITVAEPIVPIYLDKAAMRKLKMNTKGTTNFLSHTFLLQYVSILLLCQHLYAYSNLFD